MEELKLLEMLRSTKGRARVAISAILEYRRGNISERRMIIAVTENKHALFSVIPGFFGNCDDNVGVAKVLQQLIYGCSNPTLNMLRAY